MYLYAVFLLFFVFFICMDIYKEFKIIVNWNTFKKFFFFFFDQKILVLGVWPLLNPYHRPASSVLHITRVIRRKRYSVRYRISLPQGYESRWSQRLTFLFKSSSIMNLSISITTLRLLGRTERGRLLDSLNGICSKIQRSLNCRFLHEVSTWQK